VVKDGESLDAVVAIHGDVVVRRGGRVVKAVALGGSVSVEGGAVVVQNAVAVGGDVKLAQGARVDKDAMALGGQVRSAPGARVAGAVIGLSLQLGQDLQSKILSELQAEGSSCRIERDAR
jgi:UDP-3-O-[3-hydroxymyristoyl] glucosamine N-acyltransferase